MADLLRLFGLLFSQSTIPWKSGVGAPFPFNCNPGKAVDATPDALAKGPEPVAAQVGRPRAQRRGPSQREGVSVRLA